MELNQGASRNKIFILGVGAQKAGTTWLHSQLCKSSQFDPGFTKEYHIFDQLNNSELFAENKSLSPRQKKRALFIQNTNRYFEYFDDLWVNNKSLCATGDITPSYAGLDLDALKMIRDKLTAKGFKPRVIFIMREPIERIWSSLRMVWRNREKELNHEEQMQYLLENHNRQGMQVRTRYNKTIQNLEQVFQTEEIYVSFYEDLFCKTSIKSLENFIGFRIPNPDFNAAVNSSPKKEGTLPTADVARAIVETYRDVYTDIEKRYGERARKLWPGFNYIKQAGND